ncbi:hypothetical protein ARMGADRAFT_1011430 [Armillaria gallica]|uniref:F-box domain-containing protein n=1 Tax=Armillaria gallica TaxID=47427 RepID=A0A2H3DNE7_ARMGA|nr:hypothetical protein ARMGADRAFT_1011430 [Armillaria gallica]
MTLNHLSSTPGDLLLEIASHLDCRLDLFNLCLTSSRIFTNVSSVLYTDVVLNSVDQCVATLAMLRRRPDVARHVRKLVVRPRRKGFYGFNFKDSALISAAVRDVVSCQRLDALTTFCWEDEELPYHDDMWFALRMCCSQLKYIKTSIGSFLPNTNAHVFDFRHLYGFSLTLTRSFYEFRADGFIINEAHPLASRLWDMLIKWSPDLEELEIEGSSPFPVDVHRLLDGHWPKLRKLSLGDVVLDWSLPSTPAGKRPFICFLEEHPDLQSLKLSKHNIHSAHLSTLDAPDLKLLSFSGTMQQLQALPDLHYSSIQSVTFTEPMHTRDITAVAIASVLHSLTSLLNLKVAFHLHSMYDSGNLLRSLVASCPRLEHLQLTCTQKPSFQLDSFSKAIKGFLRLRSLDLAIVRYPGDDTLSTGAERIAMSNPRLKSFTLTFLPLPYPLQLPFSFTLLPFAGQSTARGSFHLTCDQHGLPRSLHARERRRLVWPWGMGYTIRTRQYTSDLRPSGFPGKRKQGMEGFLGLITENSSAGEEMRMILFCGFLVCLALWGFLASTRGHDTNIGNMHVLYV